MRIDLGKLPQALEDLGQAARLDGEFEGAPYSAGVAKQALGDYRGAAEAYAVALKVNSGMRQALLRRADALSSAGDRDEALLLLDKAIREDPTAAGAFIQRGGLKMEVHDAPAAVEDYSRVVELLPDEAVGYGLRASAFRDALRLQEAENDYGEAIKRRPDDASYLMSRGRVRYHRKKYMDALDDWKKAIALDASYRGEVRAYAEYIQSLLKPVAPEKPAKTTRKK